MKESAKTVALVEPWIAAKRRVASLESQLAQAQAELRQATNTLGNWLTPDDAKTGEQFHIWFGSGILRAVLTLDAGDGISSYVVDWRKEPEAKQATEQGV